MSSISLANILVHCDSANSDNFKSTRRATYTVSSSESEDGGVVIRIVKDKRRIEEEDDFRPVYDYNILSKRRRLLEANGRGEDDEEDDDDYKPSFLKPQKAAKKVAKKRGWHCHVCQLSTSGQRVRCPCKKLIHKVCKSYGLCAPK